MIRIFVLLLFLLSNFLAQAESINISNIKFNKNENEYQLLFDIQNNTAIDQQITKIATNHADITPVIYKQVDDNGILKKFFLQKIALPAKYKVSLNKDFFIKFDVRQLPNHLDLIITLSDDQILLVPLKME